MGRAEKVAERRVEEILKDRDRERRDRMDAVRVVLENLVQAVRSGVLEAYRADEVLGLNTLIRLEKAVVEARKIIRRANGLPSSEPLFVRDEEEPVPDPGEIQDVVAEARPGDGGRSAHVVDQYSTEFGTTIRDCLDCGALVAGGPTRCGRCAKAP